MTSPELGLVTTIEPAASEESEASEAVLLNGPLSYITAIAELIDAQAAHRTNGRTNLESRADFQLRINGLADDAYPVLKNAKPEEITTMQDFLIGLDVQVGKRVVIEIERARQRRERAQEISEKGPRSLPRPRQRRNPVTNLRR